MGEKEAAVEAVTTKAAAVATRKAMRMEDGDMVNGRWWGNCEMKTKGRNIEIVGHFTSPLPPRLIVTSTYMYVTSDRGNLLH